jgi:S-adenosylmethionine hydrolase
MGGFECIGLVTDYGYEAGFVGVLHAVAISIAPDVPVLDLDHSVPAADVRLGALRLERLVKYVPPAVLVGVVDPGVGGKRRPIAIGTTRHLFVGPDNGLLYWAALASAGGGDVTAVVLDDEQYWLPDRSLTFDGRDIFVPVAAHLAAGRPLTDVGSPVDTGALVALDRPASRLDGDGAHLEILQVDGFGNVQLGGDRLVAEELGWKHGDMLELSPGGAVATYCSTFGDVGAGEALVLLDSDGCLSVSLNRGRGDSVLALPAGAVVTLRLAARAL